MATGKNGTILVVDDEEIMREILETLLTREGYEVRLATSGEEGIDIARAMPVDAAIVDIMMPGAGGLEVLSKARDEGTRTLIIVITAASTTARQVFSTIVLHLHARLSSCRSPLIRAYLSGKPGYDGKFAVQAHANLLPLYRVSRG